MTKKHTTDLSIDEFARFENNGKILVYNAIDRTTVDFQRILDCAVWFAQRGKTVVMTPKMDVPYKNPAYDIIYGSLKGTAYYGKCPDFMVDGIWYEHEGYSGKNPQRSFRNMCNHGSKQSNRIIVEDCGLTDGYMLRSIASRITVGIDIQELWVKRGTKLRPLYKTEGQCKKH